MSVRHATRPGGAVHAELDGGISRGLVLLLATACGTAAANLYYAQPLLHTLAGAFGVSNGTAGLLITISQLGYVLGLALLVPLGDLHERRELIRPPCCSPRWRWRWRPPPRPSPCSGPRSPWWG
jgi:hypothetical protein